jgi:hypothetical protein
MPFLPGDARSFTEYRPQCYIDQQLKKQVNADNDYNYRILLQKNAEQIIKQNTLFALKNEMASPICKSCGKTKH